MLRNMSSHSLDFKDFLACVFNFVIAAKLDVHSISVLVRPMEIDYLGWRQNMRKSLVVD